MSGARRRLAGLLASVGLVASASATQGGVLTYRIEDTARLHLFLADDQARPLRSLRRAAEFARGARHRLVFAMNAGIYEPDLRPTGLAVEGGRVLAPINTRRGEGNFFAAPNGVFYVGADGARTVRTTS